MNVLIYNEYLHEREEGEAKRLYPEGIHHRLAEALLDIDDSLQFSFATLEDHAYVITEEKLRETDVLIWWGHMAHHRVEDHVVDLVCEAVNKGMGLVCLHSGHESKVFRRLMGTRCSVHWRVDYENGNIWLLDETHPLCHGVHNPIRLEAEETYSEPFDVPVPDELVGITWWKGGEIFRSLCVYKRGHGKIVYFQPGHETLGSYYNDDVIRVIDNAIHYTAPSVRINELTSRYRLPEEKDVRKALYQAPEERESLVVSWDELGNGTVRYTGAEHPHTYELNVDP